MTALETILKSRKDSVEKVAKQVADLDAVLKDCALAVKPVYEAEKKVKAQRLERLRKEVAVLEAEVKRIDESQGVLPLKPAPAKK